MGTRKRKVFTGQQKARVALEALKGTKTTNEIGVWGAVELKKHLRQPE